MTHLLTGTELRQQRESAGLDLAEVAVLTGLPAAFIELLESERHKSPTYIHRVSKAIAARTQKGIHA